MKSPCSATSVTLATDEMDNVVDKQPLAADSKNRQQLEKYKKEQNLSAIETQGVVSGV